MICEFTVNRPGAESPHAVATVRLLRSRREFLAEAVLLGYEPSEVPEERGITFNVECTQTGAKTSIILINAELMDLQLIIHEARHAFFWNSSTRHGELRVNLLDAEEDEEFCSTLDEFTARVVNTIEETIGWKLYWNAL